MNDTAVLVNRQSGDYYRHIKDDTYKNLRTGVTGIIEPDLVKSLFVLSVAGSFILNQYPLVEKLIAVGFKNSN